MEVNMLRKFKFLSLIMTLSIISSMFISSAFAISYKNEETVKNEDYIYKELCDLETHFREESFAEYAVNVQNFREKIAISKQNKETADTIKIIREEYIDAITTNKSSSKYAIPVATVLAYFKAKKYYLAAELLAHAKSNKTINSYYSPSYGYLVKYSSVTTKLYKNKSVGQSGSDCYPSSSNRTLQDLYYAIHCFNYKRERRYLAIKDRYDYAPEKGYPSKIANIAVSTMYNAQKAGYLTPFYTYIEYA